MEIFFRKSLVAALAGGIFAAALGLLRHARQSSVASPSFAERQAFRDAPGEDQNFSRELSGIQEQTGATSGAPAAAAPAIERQKVEIVPTDVSRPSGDVAVPPTLRWFPDYSVQNDLPLCADSIQEDLVAIAPRKLPATLQSMWLDQSEWKTLNLGIRVPVSRSAEVQGVLRQIESAASYEEAVGILVRYMHAIGVIQDFRLLKLVHGSSVSPKIILRDGLISRDELNARELRCKQADVPWHMKGGTFGSSGIYFTRDGDVTNSMRPAFYGGYLYKVQLADARVLFLDVDLDVFLLRLYDSIRLFWGKAGSLPSDFHVDRLHWEKYSGMLKEGLWGILPSMYPDFGLDGIYYREKGPRCEIFIRGDAVDPSHIVAVEKVEQPPIHGHQDE